jgi:soluble lytic murein transglycosylase
MVSFLLRRFAWGVFLISSLLYANNEPKQERLITLAQLQKMPQSFTKDFYIWQYLQQDISKNEANEALWQANWVNNELFFEYAKKIDHDETYAIVQCMQANAQELVNTYDDCIVLGLTPYKALQLNYQEKLTVIEKLQKSYPIESQTIEVLNAPLPFTKLISAPQEVFFKVFNKSGHAFRENFLNYTIPVHILNRLSTQKEFNQTIKLIITNPNLSNLQQSLLLSFHTQELNHQSLFLLALNALRYDKKELALLYLNQAHLSAYFQIDKDKTLFWQYLISEDEAFLKTVLNSWEVNIYSIFAHEYFNEPLKNVKYALNPTKTSQKTSFDASNPFEWVMELRQMNNLTQDNLIEYEQKFNTTNTLPHLGFVYNKLYYYKTSYFITPYKEILSPLDTQRQALIYAIAKQESQFIPTAISPAYAVGVMQIMPFLAENIAKKFNDEFNIFEQFNPNTNIKYANFHLDYLQQHLKHPLLMAYAYNGGIGFFKAELQRGLFNFKSKNIKAYEPFLSMEFISYDESKAYGKKVLANYYVYLNHLKKEPTLFSTILQNLTHTVQTLDVQK